MQTAKLFMNGRSQAVRLPKEFRFAGDEVLIQKHGNAVILFPKKAGWESFLHALNEFTPDFPAERQQTKTQKRDDLFS